MILGVLLSRRTHLRVLAPVVDAAQRRQHSVLLIVRPRAAKKGDALKAQEVRARWPDVRQGACVPHWLDALVGLDGDLDAGFARKFRTVSVCAWFDDNWLRPPRFDGVVQTYISEYHRDAHAGLYMQRADGPVVGWTPGDAAPLGPQARTLAVFFALKMGVEPWRDSREGQRTYKAWVRHARARAHAEGLTFVIKTRAKNKDPWWLRWQADEVVSDEGNSLELLARARWCVHFESGAGLEAALMGCYSLVLDVPQPHLMDLPGSRLQYGGVELHDWPGVTRYGLEGPTGVDEEQRAKYCSHFLGLCDGRAGERVVDVMEGK